MFGMRAAQIKQRLRSTIVVLGAIIVFMPVSVLADGSCYEDPDEGRCIRASYSTSDWESFCGTIIPIGEGKAFRAQCYSTAYDSVSVTERQGLCYRYLS